MSYFINSLNLSFSDFMYTHSEDLFITAMFLKRYRGRTEEGLGSAIKSKELKNRVFYLLPTKQTFQGSFQ